jgi:hypothetical protein
MLKAYQRPADPRDPDELPGTNGLQARPPHRAG